MPRGSDITVADRLLPPRPALTGVNGALDRINTQPLPDGALAWVVPEANFYVLDKNSVEAPSGNSVIQPLVGLGRWLIVPRSSGGAGAPLVGGHTTIDGIMSPALALTQSDVFTPVISASFDVGTTLAQVTGDGNGRLTYTGSVAIQIPIYGQLSASPTQDLGGVRDSRLVIAINGTPIPDTGGFARLTGPTDQARLVTKVFVTLNPADELELQFRCPLPFTPIDFQISGVALVIG